MNIRHFLGCVWALALVPACGGDTTAVDAGGDAAHVGADSGVDAAADAFAPPSDTGVDAAIGMDAGMTDGCELGNTYPPLTFAHVGTAPAIPVGIELAPGRDDLFVVLRRGQIVIMNATTGAVGATPFLDIASRLGGTPTGMDEWGLLGLAFHPDYATNGLLYIAYTASTGGAYEDRVAVVTRTTADTATFGSDIFVIPDPASNHNGGQLGFGPDGYLYYGVGDGGVQYDPMMHGQDTTQALGKIHRFQVGPGITGYNPAPGNPFIAGGGLPTIWAYGLRNPWRFGWDSRTGDLYIADVGQDRWEEVDFVAAGTGAGFNFGWSYCEGTHDLCYFDTGSGTDVCNPNYSGGCASLSGGQRPIVEYPHSGGLMSAGGGASVTGGYVYRGALIPNLRGAYVFADEVTSAFAAVRHCAGAADMAVSLPGLSNADCQNPTTFGRDRAGELLVACFSDRGIYRIVAP